MEVGITDHEGLPENCIVSVRYGATRRQASLEVLKEKTLKFPGCVGSCDEMMKINVFAPIAAGILVPYPHEETYHVGLEGTNGSSMAIGLNVAPASKIDAQSFNEPVASHLKVHEAASGARDYLERHGLLRYTQAVLHAVISEKPEDPYEFMMQQLRAAQGQGQSNQSFGIAATPVPKVKAAPDAVVQETFTPNERRAAVAEKEAVALAPHTVSPEPAVPKQAEETPLPAHGDSNRLASPKAKAAPPSTSAAAQGSAMGEASLLADASLRPSLEAHAPDSIENLKEQFRLRMERALASGLFEQVINGMVNKAPTTSSPVAADAQIALPPAQNEAAYDSQEQRASQPVSQEHRMQELRGRLLTLFEAAYKNGELESLVPDGAATGGEAAEQPVSNQANTNPVPRLGPSSEIALAQKNSKLEDVKNRLRDALETARESGLLETALKEASSEEELQQTEENSFGMQTSSSKAQDPSSSVEIMSLKEELTSMGKATESLNKKILQLTVDMRDLQSTQSTLETKVHSNPATD